jgi:hypothetical protein
MQFVPVRRVGDGASGGPLLRSELRWDALWRLCFLELPVDAAAALGEFDRFVRPTLRAVSLPDQSHCESGIRRQTFIETRLDLICGVTLGLVTVFDFPA